MPVSTGPPGEPRAKRCKHCDESSHRSDSGSGYWQLQLDRDLVDTISAIYPEWFKNNNKMAEGGSPSTPRVSPPKAVVDTSPLLLEQNKESLKVKLMLRRPFDQLVAQGIMPPHKTPAAYHGQRRQLERAKTGDMLKAKIQQRPPRHELERRHILEDNPGHVDPSLAERQRMLKKARLADQLNDQLSHRPGPLELIQKNILHTEEPIESAVKAGQIPYKATCEGQLNRPTHPNVYINPEDDSQSSEGDLVSPGPSSQSSDVLETAAKSAGIVVSLIPDGTVVLATPATPKDSHSQSSDVFAELHRSVNAPILQGGASPASLVSSTSTLSPLSSVCSPVPSVISQPATPAPPPLPRLTPSPAKSDAPGKDKNRKKNKSKSAPKARTIKFHEYKGPPSAQQKNTSSSSASNGESSYDLLLQQQTLLLQFQLQLQHKYPQIILPASQKTSQNAQAIDASPAPSTSTSSDSNSSIASTKLILGRLEDMKVSDLKAELKRRSLPVSGSKPQLIERLKPFANNDMSGEIEDHNEIGSPQTVNTDDLCESMDIGEPLSPQNPLISDAHLGSVQNILPTNTQMTNQMGTNQIGTNLGNNQLATNQQITVNQIASNKIAPKQISNGSQINVNQQIPNQLGNQTILITGSEAVTNNHNALDGQQNVLSSNQNVLTNQNVLSNNHVLSNQNVMGNNQNVLGSNQNVIGGVLAGQVIGTTINGNQILANIAQTQNGLMKKKSQDDIVREQQRQIEELQRELTLSQLKLQAATRQEPKAQLVALQKHLQARQQQQQMSAQLQQLQALQARQAQTNQEEQRIQQQQHVAFQNQKNNLMQGGLILNSADAAIVLNLIQGKAKLLNGRTNSLPNFVNFVPAKDVEASKPPPPLYDEATKNKCASPERIDGDSGDNNKKDGKNNVKSQIVDDVLEILIKNGELPPSAANDPSTPGSAGPKMVPEPEFPTNNASEYDLDSSDLLETLETLDNMDFSQLVMELNGPQSTQMESEPSAIESEVNLNSPVPMDTDEWLESFLPSDNTLSMTPQCDSELRFDPLLGLAQDPYDPFCLEEFRSNELPSGLWDKVDFAA